MIHFVVQFFMIKLIKFGNAEKIHFITYKLIPKINFVSSSQMQILSELFGIHERSDNKVRHF